VISPPAKAEPAPEGHALPVVPRCSIEGSRDVGPPVDHDRISGCVHDVPAADVKHLFGIDVDTAEEQRHRGVIDEGLRLPVLGGLQVRLGDAVAPLRLERKRVLAHPPQVLRACARYARSAVMTGSTAGTDHAGSFPARTSSASMIRYA
jgi:hypothetical protein